MSFVITVYTREGIVMASDSRLTLNAESSNEDGNTTLLAAGMSDTNYKTFLAKNDIGISIFGQADINGVPISGYIDSFINSNSGNRTVTEIAGDLNLYFREFDVVPNSRFLIAGYEETDDGIKQLIYSVIPAENTTTRLNPKNDNGETQGAQWGGESDIMSRLITPMFSNNGDEYQPLPNFPIPWSFFTLQDEIDFAVYAIRTTIDSVRFQPRAKTVGGPIDVLVITPTGANWIARKELEV